MPTHKANLTTELSITQLSDVTGFAKETVSKRLRRAGVQPAREDGRTLFFAPREALPVLYGGQESRWHSARGNGSGKGPEPADFCFGGAGPLQTVTGHELMELMRWSWEDALEAITWALPFVQCGRRNSPSAWRFTIGHTTRWAGYVSQAFKIHDPLDLVTELRRLREAAQLPLDVPTGLEPFRKEERHAAD